MLRRRPLGPMLGLLLLGLLVSHVPSALSVGLYSAGEDPLEVLSASSLGRAVFHSRGAWLVEFYASWCGHCVRFAPAFKALARDLADWRPAVMLGVLDCAEQTNQKICSEFEITGYPTLKFFKAFSMKPEDGIRLYHHGDDIQSLRESIITSLESHENVWPPACPPLEPISAAELHGFFQANNVTYLALIFEQEHSFLGREVTLDMLQFENIAVRRVLKSNEELVRSFNVTTFPSGFLLAKNGSCKSIPVHGDSRSLYTSFLRSLPRVFRGNAFRPTMLPTPQPTTAPAPWRVADRKKVYMADLESAVLYTLRVEAARFLHLDKERLFALKKYVNVLAKYFPGRRVVMNYLRNLDIWLKSKTNISSNEWERALRNNPELPYARLPENPLWVGCQGSKPEFRGFPCGLWLLFHVLTVQEALHSPNLASPSELLPTMRGYVRYFFGCRECAEHFEGMASESMDKVKNKDGAVLWLWSRHNRVNNRLAGTPSDDPKFPKIQWPPQDLCWSCQIVVNGRRVWDERAILRFLKAHFSRPNIYLDFIKREVEFHKPLARHSRDVEETEPVEETEWAEEENGRQDENEFEEDKKRIEKPESGRVTRRRSGLERSGLAEQHKPSIVKMSTKTKELEEDIVDLDTFSEQHYKSKALKMAGQPGGKHKRSKREVGLVRMEEEGQQSFHVDAAWERLKRKSWGGQQLIGAMAEEVEKENGIDLRRNQWIHILGVGFSQLDISLCIVLYFISSMCLLGMYTFFRMRMRYRKGRSGFPVA